MYRRKSWRWSHLFIVLLGTTLLFGCGSDDDDDPGPGPDPTAPDAPGLVQVTAGDGSVALMWTPSDDATSYSVYWSTQPGVSTDDTVVPDAVSPFIHQDLSNGTAYYYMVTASNDVGESGASDEVTATPSMSGAYVSLTTGDDANDGSKATPVRTLARGYEVALNNSLDTVHLEEGVYDEIPEFVEGIWIEGGHQLPDWKVGPNRSLFEVGAGRAIAEALSDLTVISNVEIVTAINSQENSIALMVTDCGDNLVFENCRFVSGAAGSGMDGSPGNTGAAGGHGGNGQPGSCDGPNGIGGTAGTSPTPACGGGGGGHGGPQGANNGVTGGTGGCNGGTGGVGGIAGVVGINGANGKTGPAGSGGSHGSSASPSGNSQPGQWTPLVSTNGGIGGNGSGGGGGGGGAGQGGPDVDEGGGNGGGGGGGGGEGGTGGSGGSGGYGSFAVFLTNSSPVFHRCEFESGQGGAGGHGGNGGRGGPGGQGGFGATACNSGVGRGGDGAPGGAGGGGGGGAGGPGGPSFGIYLYASSPVLNEPTFTIGAPGSGGRGGMRGGTTAQAPGGDRGNSGEISQ